MAELIPPSYRMHVAQRRVTARWVLGGAAVTFLCAASLCYAMFWETNCESKFHLLDQQYKEKSALIVRSQTLRARRLELASRMQKIQELMDDKVLLSLLRNISSSFAGNNCLEFISIDARGTPQPDGSKPLDESKQKYLVRITGITENSTTLAELMTRLGRRSDPPVNVVLESSRRENLLDGQVMRFQIVCEQPQKAGA